MGGIWLRASWMAPLLDMAREVGAAVLVHVGRAGVEVPFPTGTYKSAIWGHFHFCKSLILLTREMGDTLDLADLPSDIHGVSTRVTEIAERAADLAFW